MPDFPVWLAWIVAVPIIGAALTYIFKKLIRPAFRAGNALGDAVPVLQEFTEQFRGEDGKTMIAVLKEIVEQVRTNGGSSLADIVRRLETAAQENAETSRDLKVAIEAARLMGTEGREDFVRLVKDLAALTVKVDDIAKGRVLDAAERKEIADALTLANEAIAAVASDAVLAVHDRQKVAGDLAAAKEKIEGVASDLLKSREQADAVDVKAPPGVAADEASKTPPEKEE